MVKSFSRLAVFLLVMALVALAGVMACTPEPTSTPTPTPTPTPIPQPVVTINSPLDGSELSVDDLTVSVSISNFNIAQKLGEAPTSGEGHIHYYIDAEPPTTTGQPAVTQPGTYAATTDNSYAWENVKAGTHTLAVQLVNNNHTPLEPPVINTVEVTIEPKQFSLVPGWYRNGQVEYYDFGASTPLVDGKVLTAPLYAFVFGTKSDGSPDFVPGQHNVIDVIPGDPGYSDLWQVNLVTVPGDYEADSVKAVSEISEKGFAITATDIRVNCPIVPARSMLETDKELIQGWYKGKAVYYFDFEANPDLAAPIYAFITGMDAQGNPQFVQGQTNVNDVVPGDDGYSAF